MKLKHLNSCQAFEFKNWEFGNFMLPFCKIFSQKAIAITIRHTNLAQATTYSLEAKISSLGQVNGSNGRQ